MSPDSPPSKPSKRWFIAFTVAVWATVVTATLLLFVGFGYCYIGDPLLKNRFVCDTLWGRTAAYDFYTLLVGTPLLILIDNLIRNPRTFRKFNEHRAVAILAVALLLLAYWLFFYWLIL